MKPTSTENAKTVPKAPRRQFLSFLWGGLGLAALAELAWVTGSFLQPGRKGAASNGPQGLVEAGAVDTFQPGTVTAFPRGRFYLARLADGGFLALSRRCPHLGCTLPWVAAQNQFVCPCHASAFDIQGAVIRSPAPRGMDLYPVTIENEVVKVATGRIVRRDRTPSPQPVYADRT
jgi:cytochrome b6-f complex iron-sulfur subunit